ncbi:MAG: hypothetical protein QM820_34555 [Minicystis sp.]
MKQGLARFGIAVAGVMTAATAIAQTEGSIEERLRRQEERLEAAEAKARAQEAEIARLRAALDAKAAIDARPIDAKPAPAEPSVLETALRSIKLSGYVQADAVLHRQSSQDEVSPAGEPLNQDRFTIPRARFRIEAARWILSAALEIDASTANGPSVRPVEASLSIRWQGPDREGVPLLEGTTGLMKIPFGFEVPQLDPQRHFLERSTAARALFPGTYDLGFRLQGGYRFLRYAIAFMNGEPTGEPSLPARDPNRGKDLVGRVGVDATPVSWLRVRAGVSALSGTGFHRGTPATKDVIVWRDANEDGLVQISEIQVIGGAPATPSQNYHRFAIGGDLGITARLPVIGELTVLGEIVRAGNLDRAVEPADPVGAGRDFRELGFHVGVTQELTQYAIIGARYDRYDADADASEQRGITRVPRDSAYSTLAVTGAVRYPPGRLIFEYDRNTNALGRTAGGLPTTLADDAFTLRAEVMF